MKEELYIKGEPVDLGDSQIALNFKSNLLGDIRKITSSNSYTIELPRTLKNERILDFPDVAAHENYLARDYFDAQYFRNGIKIFDAKAVITSSRSDGFSIALTWGIDESLITLINDNKSIQEFADMALPWNSSTTYDNGLVDGQLSHGYIPHNSGIDVDSHRDIIFVHPAANCMRLLEEIAEYYGLTMDWGNYKQYIELLYLPLISQKANPKYNYFQAEFIKINDLGLEMSLISPLSGISLASANAYIKIDDLSTDWDLLVTIFTNAPSNTSNVVHVRFYGDGANFYNLYLNSDSSGTCSYKGKIPGNINNYSYVTFNFIIQNGYTIIEGNGGIVKLSSINYDNKQLSYGGVYPIGSNLPDISVVDFIKQICWLFGLFAIKSDTGVSFISVNKIIDNKNKSVDWGKKLVPTGWTAKETSYTFGDFAQKNYFRYEENENAKSADGYMVVQNKTLDHEKDLVKLPYTAGGDNGDMRAVPYFKWSEDGTTIELEDCGDRIMQLVIRFDSQGKEDARLEFSDLKFQNRISRFGLLYYQEIIKYPFVIKDDFRLTCIDLKSIDMTKPVYIQQYGAFFAIVSIKTQGEISEVELLKLK